MGREPLHVAEVVLGALFQEDVHHVHVARLEGPQQGNATVRHGLVNLGAFLKGQEIDNTCTELCLIFKCVSIRTILPKLCFPPGQGKKKTLTYLEGHTARYERCSYSPF